MKALQTHLFISLQCVCTETLQWNCYSSAVIVFLPVIAMISLCVIAALGKKLAAIEKFDFLSA